jgi:hypothetical protein
MKNKEKFQKELADMILSSKHLAVVGGKPVCCGDLDSDCAGCYLRDRAGLTCVQRRKEWGEEEYNEPLLTASEKEFLQYLVDHIRPRIVSIEKCEYGDNSEFECKEFLNIETVDEQRKPCVSSLPDFDKGTMYKCLEIGKEYTPEELGLKVKK